MTLTLMTFPPNFGTPSSSPFCTKVMCLLRMSGLDWVADTGANVLKSPKKKLPVLQDGSELIADSSTILNHLETRHGCDFNAGMSEAEIAHSHGLVRMVEEHTYFALMTDRWLIDTHWDKLRVAYFAHLPFGIRSVVPPLVRRDVDRTCRGQGMARFSLDEQAVRIQRDIEAVEATLGDTPFLFGERPTSADASVAPMMDGLFRPQFTDGIMPKLKASDNLRGYIARCQDELFPTADKLEWRDV